MTNKKKKESRPEESAIKSVQLLVLMDCFPGKMCLSVSRIYAGALDKKNKLKNRN